VLPIEPWKADARQVAQQASFLCATDVDLDLVENLAALGEPPKLQPIYKLIIPGALRESALEQLWLMNVTAATLFPAALRVR